MSHYTLTVVLPEVPKSKGHLEEMLTPLLEPFCEELEVEPYKDYLKPVVEHWRDATKRELAWPYAALRDNPEIDLGDPKAVAEAMNKRYEGEEPGYEVDEEGLFQWSTYNPNSKWDWWVVGGRWTGYYELLPGATGFTGHPGTFGDQAEDGHVDVARKGDINAEKRVSTYAVLAEGVWRAPGKMGWFGMSTESNPEQQDYDKWFASFWSGLGDDAWLAVLDLHI